VPRLAVEPEAVVALIVVALADNLAVLVLTVVELDAVELVVGAAVELDYIDHNPRPAVRRHDYRAFAFQHQQSR
jgi:hypothetical protein